MKTKNSTFLICPLKEIDTGDLRELRQENPRKKKKKPAKRLPLQEMVSSDSDDSSHGIRSQESNPKKYPKPKVGGGRHRLSLEHPETSLKNSALEIAPQFPGQFSSQYSKNSNTLK